MAAVQRVIDVITDASQPAWAVGAVAGLDAGSPALARPRPGDVGIRRRRWRPWPARAQARLAAGWLWCAGRGVALPAEPAALTKLASGTDAIALVAKNVSAKLDWPGRPAPVITAAPLTPEQQKRFDAGAEIYKNLCLGCHQEDGRGKEKLGANLVDSPYVTAADASAMIRVLVGGKEGPIGLMPPLGPADRRADRGVPHLRAACVGSHGLGRRSVERDGSARPVEGPGPSPGPTTN